MSRHRDRRMCHDNNEKRKTTDEGRNRITKPRKIRTRREKDT